MSSWAYRADAITRRATRFIALIGLLGLLVLAGATTVDISLRFVLNAPIHGLSDLGELVITLMVAASFPAALAGREQITIRFLGKVVPWRVCEGLDLFGHVLMLLVFMIAGWQLVIYTVGLYAANQTTWLLGIPMGPTWTVATMLILLCTPVQAVVVVIHFIRMIAATKPDTFSSIGEEFAGIADNERGLL